MEIGLDEVMKTICSKVEHILTEYVGDEVSFSIPIKESVDNGKYLQLTGLKKRVHDQAVSILCEEPKFLPHIEWDSIYNMKEKLSLYFIFGTNDNALINFKRLEFLNDLREISAKTYESTPVNIGVIFCEELDIAYFKMSFKDSINIIKLPERSSIKEFFKEKPFLRLIDGESLNLLVNNDFQVYGIVRTNQDNFNVANEIIKQFERWNLRNDIPLIKKPIIESLDDVISQSDNPTLRNFLLERRREFEDVDFDFGELNKPNFIYFKAENTNLSIYNTEEFVISFEKGNWKLKNFQILKYILLNQSIRSNLLSKILIAPFEESRINNIMNEILNRLDILIETVSFLSQNNRSSIIVFVQDKEGDSSSLEEIERAILLTLNEEEAQRLLTLAPLKKRDSDQLYLKLIKDEGKHINTSQMGAKLLGDICSIDGALILDDVFNIISFGEVIEVTNQKFDESTYGTGTNACQIASKDGIAIKVSEDGDIQVFVNGEKSLTI